MFTGIVEEQGVVEQLEDRPNLAVLKVKCRKVHAGSRVGDSIAVNGVCLTISKIKGRTLTFDIMKETLLKTTLKNLRVRKRVNLERALKANSRFSGHFVTGHIDGLGIITKKIVQKNYVEFKISTDKGLRRYLVTKGSVCIDGVSLTIGEVKQNRFSVFLIPHTRKITTLGTIQQGGPVNIETDILARYVLGS